TGGVVFLISGAAVWIGFAAATIAGGTPGTLAFNSGCFKSAAAETGGLAGSTAATTGGATGLAAATGAVTGDWATATENAGWCKSGCCSPDSGAAAIWTGASAIAAGVDTFEFTVGSGCCGAEVAI